MSGRTLDKNLAYDKQAREYTKKVYKKSFEKKRSIDLKNQKRPEEGNGESNGNESAIEEEKH